MFAIPTSDINIFNEGLSAGKRKTQTSATQVVQQLEMKSLTKPNLANRSRYLAADSPLQHVNKNLEVKADESTPSVRAVFEPKKLR